MRRHRRSQDQEQELGIVGGIGCLLLVAEHTRGTGGRVCYLLQKSGRSPIRGWGEFVDWMVHDTGFLLVTPQYARCPIGLSEFQGPTQRAYWRSHRGLMFIGLIKSHRLAQAPWEEPMGKRVSHWSKLPHSIALVRPMGECC